MLYFVVKIERETCLVIKVISLLELRSNLKCQTELTDSGAKD